MVLTDPWVVRVLRPSESAGIAGEVCGAILVLLVGWAIKKRR
jgi:hypothetical protein